MKEQIQSIMELKGFKLPEEDYDVLVKRWEYAMSLKQGLKATKLNEANIGLRFVPDVGCFSE